MKKQKFQQIKLHTQSRSSYTQLYTLKTEVDRSRIAVVRSNLYRNICQHIVELKKKGK